MSSFTLPLRIIPKDDKVDELLAVAKELDYEATGDSRESYTVPQAFVPVLHFAPERLREFAQGWYVDNTPLIEDERN